MPERSASLVSWLYLRFPPNLRTVEEMLAACGVVVSHDTVRQWGVKFERTFANAVHRRLTQPSDKWHPDAVGLSTAGRQHWLWQAVDRNGVVHGILVESRRNSAAAKRLLRKLLKRRSLTSRVLVTDKPGSQMAPDSHRSCNRTGPSGGLVPRFRWE